MPASELEALVEDRIRAMLKDPAAILEFAGSTPVAARKSLIERAAELAQRWPALSPSERRGILSACLSRVEVRAETIEITVRPLRLVAAVHGDQNHGRSDRTHKGPTTNLTIPARVKRTGLSNTLVIDGHPRGSAKPDRCLLRLIAMARGFNELVSGGAGLTITELATQAGVSRSYFSRVLRLSFLAPEITKAIVQGRQPVDFSAIKLMRAGQFPLRWPDQRRHLGFD